MIYKNTLPGGYVTYQYIFKKGFHILLNENPSVQMLCPSFQPIH